MPLSPFVARIQSITPAQTEEMFALHRRYYDRVRRETFIRDMMEKQWCVILKDHENNITGFTTIQVIELEVDGELQRFIFSGDTVVDSRSRMSPALAGSFGHVLLRLMEQHGEKGLFWFLISKGFRTYRFLPVFFKRFYPAFDGSRMPDIRRRLDAIATHKFKSLYNPHTGVIHTAGAGDRLKPQLNETPPHRLEDRHIAFFLKRNPGHADGDELACLAEVSRANLNRFAWRVIEQTKVEWDA